MVTSRCNRCKLGSAAVALLAAALCAAPAHAQKQGESWEMSGSMQMEGMNMPMPPSRVCITPDEGASPPVQDNCKVTDKKVSGSTTSFKIVCGPPEPMQGSGEMMRKGDKMEGRYTLKSKDGEMKMAIAGRKLGACKPGTPPALVK